MHHAPRAGGHLSRQHGFEQEPANILLRYTNQPHSVPSTDAVLLCNAWAAAPLDIMELVRSCCILDRLIVGGAWATMLLQVADPGLLGGPCNIRFFLGIRCGCPVSSIMHSPYSVGRKTCFTCHTRSIEFGSWVANTMKCFMLYLSVGDSMLYPRHIMIASHQNVLALHCVEVVMIMESMAIPVYENTSAPYAFTTAQGNYV